MRARRLQALLIRLVGATELLAFFVVPMPRAWLAAAHERLGLGTMPAGPVFEALMRDVSLTYGLHGIGMIVIAMDVVRYRPLVAVTALGYLVAGPAFILIDLGVGLPWYWHVGNGAGCLLIGMLLAWLVWRDREP